MTSSEATALINSVGFPIVFVGAALAFFAIKVWPWITARVERQDKEQQGRHLGYLSEMAQTREIFVRVIAALDSLVKELSVTASQMAANRHAEQAEHDHLAAELRRLREVREPTARELDRDDYNPLKAR